MVLWMVFSRVFTLRCRRKTASLFSATQFANFLRDFVPTFPEIASQLAPLNGLKKEAFAKELSRNEKEVMTKGAPGQTDAFLEQDGNQDNPTNAHTRVCLPLHIDKGPFLNPGTTNENH